MVVWDGSGKLFHRTSEQKTSDLVAVRSLSIPRRNNRENFIFFLCCCRSYVKVREHLYVGGVWK